MDAILVGHAEALEIMANNLRLLAMGGLPTPSSGDEAPASPCPHPPEMRRELAPRWGRRFSVCVKCGGTLPSGDEAQESSLEERVAAVESRLRTWIQQDVQLINQRIDELEQRLEAGPPSPLPTPSPAEPEANPPLPDWWRRLNQMEARLQALEEMLPMTFEGRLVALGRWLRATPLDAANRPNRRCG